MLALAIVAKALPKKLVFELAYGGEMVDAETIMKWDLANKVTDNDKVLEEACKFAEKLSTYNVLAAQLGREAYYNMVNMTTESAVHYGKGQLLALLTAEDTKEAHYALQQGRNPVYQGK